MQSRLLTVTVLALLAFQLPAAAQQPLEQLSFSKRLKLAKVGDDEAQLSVGIDYEEGNSVEADAQEAAKWYRQAALLGNLDAQYRLARLVSKGGPGLNKNQTMAIQLYEAAAKGGNALAQNAMGDIYQNGRGVPVDLAKAVEWYGKAAAQKHAPAQNSLGLMHLNGAGVPRDLGKAAQYFQQAAEQGDGWGLNNLGGMYEMGWGVPKDAAKAAAFYKQAVEKGVEPARKNLVRVEPAAAR